MSGRPSPQRGSTSWRSSSNFRTSPSIARGPPGRCRSRSGGAPPSFEAGVARPVGEVLHAAELDLQAQRPGHRPDRGVSLDHVALAVGLDRARGERDRRPQGHVDHVGLEDVRVRVRDAGVDGVEVDEGGDRGRLERSPTTASTEKRLKRPRTLDTPRCRMWRMVKPTEECAGSRVQAPAARGSAVVVVMAPTLRASRGGRQTGSFPASPILVVGGPGWFPDRRGMLYRWSTSSRWVRSSGPAGSSCAPATSGCRTTAADGRPACVGRRSPPSLV